MSKTNSEIVREYFEEVFNRKHFENTFNYCSQDCVFHNSAYVGVGFVPDDSSNERVLVKEIIPNSPAVGKLQVNDEIARVRDAGNDWKTFKELKSGTWGQGIINSELTITVKRNGQLLDIPIIRGRIEAYDLKLSSMIDTWKSYTLKYVPESNIEIKVIFEKEDLVAYYAVDTATNLEYHQSAVWDECGIYRLKNGKIIEMWGAENSFSQMKQYGYQIVEPLNKP